jgi:lyso-ornithine lipid O-acyltransferase
LLNKLRFCWRFAAFLVVTALYWALFEVSLLLAGKRRRIEMINRWVPRWANLCLVIFRITVDARGSVLDGRRTVPGHNDAGHGRVFVANHRSTVDILVMLSRVEAHCISRHDVANWPILGWGARRAGTLFVDRQSRRSGADVLREVAQAIEAGEGVIMFPEGTSHAGDEVRPFRTGAFNTVRRTAAEVVPAGIAYDDERACYENESIVTHALRVVSLPRLRVALEIGGPIPQSELPTPELTELARSTVQELVYQARARLRSDE